MKIAVIGVGNIGSTLGRKWVAAGHEVAFGVRDPDSAKVEALRDSISDATFYTPKKAATVSDILLLAVPGKAVDAVLGDVEETLSDKTVIDAANAISQYVMHSLELIKRLAPDAKVFRAFNSLGWENFAEPELSGVKIDHFYCGASDHADVHKLIGDVGINPIYLGGLEHAPTLDALTRLWFTLTQTYGRRVALKVITEA